MLAELWARGEALTADGLHLASGAALAAEPAPGTETGLRLLAPFDLAEELRADPERVTHVDIAEEEPLEDGGRLVCGGGTWGSEGFFGRLAPDGSPRWLLYLDCCNPFATVLRLGSVAAFWSTSGVVVAVDIDDPRQPPRIPGG